MSIESRSNVLVSQYVRRQMPTLDDSVKTYIRDELQEIEAAMRTLVDAAPQVAEKEPPTTRRGMVRYAISPWNPLGNGTQGLVVYNGTAWVAV